MASPDKQPSNETRYDLSDFDLNMSLDSVNSLSSVKIQHFNDENMDISNQLNSSDHGGSYNVLNCSLNSTLPGFVSSDDILHDSFTLASNTSFFSQLNLPLSPITSTRKDTVASEQIVYPYDQSEPSEDDSLVYSTTSQSRSVMSPGDAADMLVALGDDSGSLSESNLSQQCVPAESSSPLTREAIQSIDHSNNPRHASKRAHGEIDDTTDETKSTDSQSTSSAKRVCRDDNPEESELRATISMR
ncbi:MAG: hypothetical protein CMF43_00655 [Legionellales bacterium]|nr:hypothetical protein [Legionellales bacterium]|tara:strand:- start:411 stop:1145 length:735 start_codon:yes stop_codon:yes gene_type:complete